jgi:hypothetical protein
MINEQRFWEAAIQEVLRNDAPPDVTARVLAGLAESAPTANPAVAPRGRVRPLRVLAEVAAAAAVVFAIGWLTGFFRVPEDGVTAEPENVAAAPGAQYEFDQGFIELNQGWLLVSTGAPDVRCNGSVLSQVDGQVLVHASGVPTRGQAEAVTGWLEANRLETGMIGEMKNWARGTVLAALVLSGSAMLDGQKIEGPKPEGTSTAEWHVVRNVRDIDNLPKGVRFVNADDLSTAYLDFLIEVESLEAISLRGAYGLSPDQVRSLKVLKKLEWLDLRGASWVDDPALETLAELPSLKRLGVDLSPPNNEDDPVLRAIALPVLKKLSERGVEIEIGEWVSPSHEALKEVLDALPTLRGLALNSAVASDMKMLAGHAALKSIELHLYGGGELGFAYLKRKALLEELSVWLWKKNLTVEELYQISQTGVRVLRIHAGLDNSPQQAFALVAGMKNLRELELSEAGIQAENLFAFAQFRSTQRLDRLRLEAGCAGGFELMVAHQVPTRRLELAMDLPPLVELESVPLLTSGEAGRHLEEIRFECQSVPFELDYLNDQHAAALRSYPNLKRVEVRRGGSDESDAEDRFVNWLRENLPGVEVMVTP